MTTCLVGTPPLRLHLLQPERRDTISQNDTSQETPSHRAPLDACPSLDTNIVDIDTCPSLDTNDISSGQTPLS